MPIAIPRAARGQEFRRLAAATPTPGEAEQTAISELALIAQGAAGVAAVAGATIKERADTENVIAADAAEQSFKLWSETLAADQIANPSTQDADGNLVPTYAPVNPEDPDELTWGVREYNEAADKFIEEQIKGLPRAAAATLRAKLEAQRVTDAVALYKTHVDLAKEHNEQAADDVLNADIINNDYVGFVTHARDYFERDVYDKEGYDKRMFAGTERAAHNDAATFLSMDPEGSQIIEYIDDLNEAAIKNPYLDVSVANGITNDLYSRAKQEDERTAIREHENFQAGRNELLTARADRLLTAKMVQDTYTAGGIPQKEVNSWMSLAESQSESVTTDPNMRAEIVKDLTELREAPRHLVADLQEELAAKMTTAMGARKLSSADYDTFIKRVDTSVEARFKTRAYSNAVRDGIRIIAGIEAPSITTALTDMTMGDDQRMQLVNFQNDLDDWVDEQPNPLRADTELWVRQNAYKYLKKEQRTAALTLTFRGQTIDGKSVMKGFKDIDTGLARDWIKANEKGFGKSRSEQLYDLLDAYENEMAATPPSADGVEVLEANRGATP